MAIHNAQLLRAVQHRAEPVLLERIGRFRQSALKNMDGGFGQRLAERHAFGSPRHKKMPAARRAQRPAHRLGTYP